MAKNYKHKPWKNYTKRKKKTNKINKTNKKTNKIESKHKENISKDKGEDNDKKAETNNINKSQHIINGNRSHYNFLQLNGSNANFMTKSEELKEMIYNNKSEIMIISEYNAEVHNINKMQDRQKEFGNFNFEDKLVDGNNKGRNTIMIHKDITYKRLYKFEDPLNSTTVIKANDGDNKWVCFMSIYCKWKLKGEFNAFDSEGINKQVKR